MNFTVEPGLATASDEHLSAFLGEARSGAQANAGTAASNDCHFSFEFSVHRLSYCAFQQLVVVYVFLIFAPIPVIEKSFG
jgi:hypothetical protein